LAYLVGTQSLDDLRVRPGFNLHKLKEDRAGQYAIRINDQYRVCFSWTSEGADKIEITDYHWMRQTMRDYPANFPIAVHPGDILQEMLDEKGVSQSQLARHLRTDIARINEICRRRRGISAEMAVKLAKAFGTSQGLWMNLQKNWELSQVDPRTASSIRLLRASA
jgi:addiction module HigA family antidote